MKVQRLDAASNSSLTINLPANPADFAATMLNMLTAPAARAKQLVTLSSIRAMLLSSEYKTARDSVIPAAKRDAFKRIVEIELLPLVAMQDAVVAEDRSSIRDTAVLRLADITVAMPEGNNKQVLEAASAMLAELATGSLDDAI